MPLSGHGRAGCCPVFTGCRYSLIQDRIVFTAGGIFLIAIPLWVEQFIKFGKSRFVHPNAGYGALFIIRILVQSPLERLVSIGIDPMIFHHFTSDCVPVAQHFILRDPAQFVPYLH